MRVAWFLYDFTGIMAQPWVDRGYTCYIFDCQHPQGVNKFSDNIYSVGLSIVPGVTDFSVYERPDFIFGFPECTDLAVSGACRFKDKREIDPEFQVKAMSHVYLVRDLGESIGCPWALENPVSVISTMWRKPNFYFHPWMYSGYLPEDDVHPTYPDYIAPRDMYNKKTGVWGSSEIKKPPEKWTRRPGDPEEYKETKVSGANPDSKQYQKLGGRSLKTKNIRSATPRGFALAFARENSV